MKARSGAIAAIDAGSNAIRLMVARPRGRGGWETLARVREPVRLGHHVFTDHRLPPASLAAAVRVFARFRSIMDHHAVGWYRAVATSASREAVNRSVLVDRVLRGSGLALEVITGAEEARLVRTAVLARLAGRRPAPGAILDLGGGSLELCTLRHGDPVVTAAMQVGTVRFLEQLGIRGPINVVRAAVIVQTVDAALASVLPASFSLAGVPAVACGGNAEALAKLAPGPKAGRHATLDLTRLLRILGDILRRDVGGRMRRFGVRRDRADVMGIAALVFVALGRRLGIRRLIVPGVGVREGLLEDLRSTPGHVRDGAPIGHVMEARA